MKPTNPSDYGEPTSPNKYNTYQGILPHAIEIGQWTGLANMDM